MTGTVESSQWSLVLRDETSAPARTMGAALSQLRAKIDADTKALRGMQSALGRIRGTSLQGGAAARHLRDQIAAQRSAIARAQASYVEMGGSFVDSSAQARGGIGGIVDALRGVPGPIGSITGRLAGLASPLALIGGLATAGIGAFVAFAAAITGAALAMARFALASADARRSELLHLEGLTTLRNVYGVAAGRASDLVAAIDRVSDASALSHGEVSSMAESLYRAGLRGANLADALDGLSIAQSVQGDRGAARFRAMAVSIARTGGSVRRLADDYRSRLGGIARRQAMSLERQSSRLRESLARIFDGVQIEGFLGGLHDVLSLLSQSTATGRALRAIVSAIFSPLFDEVGSGAPIVRRFFQGIVLASLRVGIVVLRLRNQFRAAFGDSSLFSGLDAGKASLLAGETLALGLGSALITVANGVMSVVRYYELLRKMPAVFDSWRVAITGVVGSWARAGAQLVDGFIGGITAGVGRVRSTVTSLAQTATDAVTGALGIHSPSRVFAGLGRQIPRGFAEGIGGGSGDVAAASESMAGASEGGVADASPNLRLALPSTRPSINVEITINGASAAAGQQAADAFLDRLGSALEGYSIEIGAAP